MLFAGLVIVTDATDMFQLIDELKLKKQEFENLYNEYYHQNSLLTQQNVDLIKLNKQLKKSRLKAEESDQLKTSFLTNMSHEIRTPLNGIIGFSQIIAGNQLGKEEVHEYSHIIAQSGEKLLAIIDDILLMAQLESGQYLYKPKKLCLDTLWNDLQYVATEFVSRKGQKRRLLLNVDQSILQHEASLDKDAIVIVFIRLLDNAIKFSDDETPIRIGFLKSEDDTLDIYVEDEGIGIPENQIPETFKRFKQLNKDNLTPVAGNGLGLSIVKEILDVMNAEIHVDSTPGKGTRFMFQIPLQFIISPNTTIDMKDMLSLPKGRKILIVEDVRDNFVLIRAYLKSFKVNLHHAVTVADASDYIEKNPDIDLIMMDIRLPDGSGMDLTKKLREKQVTCPIIAQTAYADSHDKHLCIEAGCTDYLAKPIHKAQFIDTLKHYLELESISV